MSRINNYKSSVSNKSNNSSNNKPKAFCGACQKAGKTMEEYTSHWTRSKPGTEGVVTCPLILTSECGYCHEMGHWTKFCPLLTNKTVVVVAEKQVKKTATKAVVVVPPKKNFDMLYMSDDEDDDDDNNEVVVAKKKSNQDSDERYPSLNLKTKVNLSLNLPKDSMSWSDIVQKPIIAVPEPVAPRAPMVRISNSYLPKMKKLNWADDNSDSDEEDEYIPTGVYA
jgi:hypothetical protein